MTTLEDRLRRALEADGEPVVMEAFLADVHEGARRRGRRRRTSALVGVATAVASVAVLLTLLPSGAPDRDREPEPARPFQVDGAQVMAPAPTRDGGLYGLSGTDCVPGCPSVLWFRDGDGRTTQVHTFTADQAVYSVDLASDNRHGFAFGRGEGATVVWRTADGGHTWDEVDEQLADYQYPPDVEYLGADAYLMTRPVSCCDPGPPHLWRTPLEGDEWEEVSLTAERHIWFDMLAGLLAVAGPDGSTVRLGVVRRSSVLVSDDGDVWDTEIALPCAYGGAPGPTFAADTPTTVMVWCAAPGRRQVQLYRSVSLGSFEPLGPPLRRGHAYPTTYPQLVAPFAVETEDDGAYAVARLGADFVRLEPGGATTDLGTIPELLPLTAADPWGSTHAPGRTYTLVPKTAVVTTGDGGLTWSSLEP